MTATGLDRRSSAVANLAKARAASEARTAARRAALIEDVEWLIGTDQPTSIAHRVGYRTAESLGWYLRRIGRTDLAIHFERRDVS